MPDDNILSEKYRDTGVLPHILVHEKVGLLIVSFTFFALSYQRTYDTVVEVVTCCCFAKLQSVSNKNMHKAK